MTGVLVNKNKFLSMNIYLILFLVVINLAVISLILVFEHYKKFTIVKILYAVLPVTLSVLVSYSVANYQNYQIHQEVNNIQEQVNKIKIQNSTVNSNNTIIGR